MNILIFICHVWLNNSRLKSGLKRICNQQMTLKQFDHQVSLLSHRQYNTSKMVCDDYYLSEIFAHSRALHGTLMRAGE